MIDAGCDDNIRPPITIDVRHPDLVGVEDRVVGHGCEASGAGCILQQYAHSIGAADNDISQPICVYILYVYRLREVTAALDRVACRRHEGAWAQCVLEEDFHRWRTTP